MKRSWARTRLARTGIRCERLSARRVGCRPGCGGLRLAPIGRGFFHCVTPTAAEERNIAVAPKRCPPSTSSCGPNPSLIPRHAAVETGNARPYAPSSTTCNLAQRSAIRNFPTEDLDDGPQDPRGWTTETASSSAGTTVLPRAGTPPALDVRPPLCPVVSAFLPGRSPPRRPSHDWAVVRTLCEVRFGRPYSRPCCWQHADPEGGRAGFPGGMLQLGCILVCAVSGRVPGWYFWSPSGAPCST